MGKRSVVVVVADVGLEWPSQGQMLAERAAVEAAAGRKTVVAAVAVVVAVASVAVTAVARPQGSASVMMTVAVLPAAVVPAVAA